MKKLFGIFVFCFTVTCFAWPSCPPPPPHHWHHHHCYYRDYSGVRLAADIVGLVGASVNLLAPRTVYVQQPVIQQPQVIYTTPVVQQPVVQQPIVIQQPVVQQQRVIYTTPTQQVIYPQTIIIK